MEKNRFSYKCVFKSFGRRPTLLMVHVVYFLGDVLTYLAPDYWTIMACRFLVGVSHHTMSHLPYLLGNFHPHICAKW